MTVTTTTVAFKNDHDDIDHGKNDSRPGNINNDKTGN